MELVSSKKLKEAEFCELCEKERKHLVVIYKDFDENNEPYTVEMKRCKSCGREQALL